MQRRAAIFLMLALAACASPGRRIDELAASAGLSRASVRAGAYSTLIYAKQGDSGRAGPLAVFLDGDGRPWHNGLEPSTDPTTHNPLALKLLIRTRGAGAYITRPCYQGLQPERCTPEQWTSARYSEGIVAGMAQAIREAAWRLNARDVMLVGYSGGGVLAVLVAERLDNVAAVITIGANLDIDAWTTQHGYLPLTRSLNPARSTRRHPWPEIHLHGARDAVVPLSTTAAYFRRYPNAQQLVMEDYDHVCCWIEHWPALLDEALAKLATSTSYDLSGRGHAVTGRKGGV